jgi:hypothetical protein
MASVPQELWSSMHDEDLLKLQILDLKLCIKGTRLEKSINELYKELQERGIIFQPPCYLADEWLSPDRIPVIGIPFFLAHPRLVQLERKMMLEVEGGTEEWCMKLLRHEAGHALNHAYALYRKSRWRELFGSAYGTRYTTVNYPRQPYSKRYVVHLDDHYAQSHPEEDFAETFAVWLDPASNWRQKYHDWPALKKLKYIDHIMGIVGTREVAETHFEKPYAASRMRSTLAAYYERRRRWLKKDFPGFYDPALRRIFSDKRDDHTVCGASEFLRSERKHIIDSVSHWTGQRKYDVAGLLRKLIRRCDDMKLMVNRANVVFDVAAFVSAVMSNRLHFSENDRKK